LIGLFPSLSPAIAWPAQEGNPVGVSCHQPVDGGCAASPGGNFTQSNFGSHARQSGQNWAGGDHPWNWNSCGIDYACGYYTPTASLKDPTTAALPAGCIANPTGSTGGGPIVNCAATRNLTIAGYDFSLHGCIPLILASGQTGTLTIRDNNFKNGPNCASNNTGPGVGAELIRAMDPSPANLDFESNNLDGDMFNAASLTGCAFLATYGSVTIKYNAIFRCEAQPVHIPSATISGAIISQSNYVEDFQLKSGGHGEFWQASLASGTVPLEQSSYDTVLQGSQVEAHGSTALITPFPGNGCCTVSKAQIDHLLGVTNTNSGVTTTSFIGWFGGSFGQITIQDSYADPTGTENGGVDFWGVQSATCANRSVLSGNVNLVSGKSANKWSSNSATRC
jgi:hypothetical protein